MHYALVVRVKQCDLLPTGSTARIFTPAIPLSIGPDREREHFRYHPNRKQGAFPEIFRQDPRRYGFSPPYLPQTVLPDFVGGALFLRISPRHPIKDKLSPPRHFPPSRVIEITIARQPAG